MRCHQLSVLSVLVAAPLANFATLAPRWDDIQMKHTWHTTQPNWEAVGPPPASATIDLHIALRPHREDALIDALYAVSDPGSPQYGIHLSKERVAQLVAPHQDTLELIRLWLEHHDVPSSSISTTQGGSGLTLTGVPVSRANEMLGASYQLYRRTGTNDTTILRTIGYALPAVLHDHVISVMPTTYFASTRTQWQTPRKRTVGDMASRELATALSSRDDSDDGSSSDSSDGEEEEITPSELRSLYRTVAYVPAATDRNALGISGFMGDYPSRADLKKFMKYYRSDAVDATFEVVEIKDGGYDTNNPALEANLNVQFGLGMVYPTPLVFFSTGGKAEPTTESNMFEWLNYMLHAPVVPQTISISYASDSESSVPEEFAKTVCRMFAQLGARGVNVLVASGNDGVGDGNCKAKDGTVRFIPEFPSSCPYVTSVGGTTRQGPEIAAKISEGGFSNYFLRPPYQAKAVPPYLEYLGRKYKKYEGMYNPAGRAMPDIAAQAIRYIVIYNKKEYVVDGTSAATPTVAGIISLLNDYRLFTHRTPFGFLNPLLYGRGRAGLNDIVSGSNKGCGTKGFPATTGWDAVTGLGTPDFVKLQEYIGG